MAPAVAGLRKHGGLLLICAAFLLCGLLRLNDVSVYTPDSCRYVLLGNSLAHGQGWLDATGPEPVRFMINPPLYSLLIAPVELLFPMSLVAVKIWTLLWGVLCLVLFYLLIRFTLDGTAAILGLFIFAFNPLLLIFSSEALSDAPFLALLLLGMLSFELAASGERNGLAGPLGLSVSALPLLREAGIAAVLAAGAFLASRRRIRKAAVIVLSAAALLGLWYVRNRSWSDAEHHSQVLNPSILFRQYFTSGESSLMSEFGLRVWYSIKSYIPQVGSILFDPIGSGQLSDLIVNPSAVYRACSSVVDALRPVLIAATFALALAGVFRDIRSSPTASYRLMFSLGYLAIILIFPAHDMRYLLPFLPLVIYYVLKAGKDARPGLLSLKSVIVPAVVLLMIPNLLGIYEMLSLNIAYNRSPERLLRYPVLPAAFRYQWKRIAAWSRDSMPENSVIASPVKDIVLATGDRKVVEIDPVAILPEFENLLRNNQVGYVFAPAQWMDLRAYEFPMRESRRLWFEPVPGVPNLMKVHSRFIEPVVRTPPHEVFDTVHPAELLRKGRMDLIAGRPRDALVTLKHLLQLSPGEAEVVYQVMVADLMSDNMADAALQYQKILSLQQTYAYIDYGRRHWDAAEALAEARGSKIPQERALQLVNAASLYWKLGYALKASGIANEAFQADSSYFAGLLSATHYTLQLGDTSRARAYLSRAEGIDAANPVVKTFRRLLSISVSLRRAGGAAERSRMHLEMAVLYDGIELGQEAFDEAEMAMGEDPHQPGPLLFMGKKLEERSHLLGAETIYLRVLAEDPGNDLAAAGIRSIRNTLAGQ